MSARTPISLLEQYRIAEALKDVKQLSDMGILRPECGQEITRYTQHGTFLLHCSLTGGHDGAHESN